MALKLDRFKGLINIPLRQELVPSYQPVDTLSSFHTLANPTQKPAGRASQTILSASADVIYINTTGHKNAHNKQPIGE